MKRVNAPPEFATAVERCGLGHAAEPLTRAMRPAIRLTAAGAPSGDAASRSRFGGMPAVPPDFEWPHWQGLPHAFVAQLDLTHLAPHDVEGALPATGALLFFYVDAMRRFEREYLPARGYASASVTERVTAGGVRVKTRTEHSGGMFPLERRPDLAADEPGAAWQVLYLSAETAPWTALEPPPSLPARDRFRACALTAASEPTLPPTESLLFEHIGLAVSDRDRYRALQAALAEPLGGEQRVHRLLGHPLQLQGDLQQASERTAGGAPAPGDTASDAAFREAARQWRLLLQVDCEPAAGIEWGGSGIVYVMIGDDDLASRRFDRAWAIEYAT